MDRRKLIAIGAVVVVVIGVASVLLARPRHSEVVLGQVKRGDILEAVYGIGTVTATKVFQLKIGVTSTIQRLHVKEGDSIKKGQKLVEFDGLSTFYAPFAGTITALPYKVGETVFPQAAILTLTDLTDRYVLVSLDQQAVVRVRSGLKSYLSFDSLRNERFEGVVSAIYANEGQFLVRIETPNLPAYILPGMTADVAIAIKTHQAVLVVPAAGLINGKVMTLKNGRKTPVAVQVGIVEGDLAAVTAPELAENDPILAWDGK